MMVAANGPQIMRKSSHRRSANFYPSYTWRELGEASGWLLVTVKVIRGIEKRLPVGVANGAWDCRRYRLPEWRSSASSS